MGHYEGLLRSHQRYCRAAPANTYAQLRYVKSMVWLEEGCVSVHVRKMDERVCVGWDGSSDEVEVDC